MESDNFSSYRFNIEESFKLPRLADLEDLEAVLNRKPTRENTFIAPVIILSDNYLLPEALSTIAFPRSSSAFDIVNQANSQKYTIIACYTQTDQSTVAPEFLNEIAVEVAIGKPISMDQEHVNLLVQARRRVKILDFIEDGDDLMAQVQVIKEKYRKTDKVLALMRQVVKRFTYYVELANLFQEDILYYVQNIENPGALADFVGSSLDMRLYQRLDLINQVNPVERLEEVLLMLVKEIKLLELESDIQTKVQNELDQNQRDVYLREQITRLQKELSDGKSGDPDIRSLEELLEKISLPEEAQTTTLKELERLKSLPQLSPESGMVSSYLHWLLELPWSETTEDNLDINHAKAVLDQNHHGLQKVKDRVLEYLAVRNLKPKHNKQPILCFVGAPGTGKTSMGKSIAESMDRKFVRLSLGGVHDEAEIRGHRRTYIGSMPGRILQTMRKIKVINPLFMLDEIDKLNADFQGDPAAALLEVLDPEQNNAFSDHYLEVPYDLSGVFFITTANTVASIPPALLDRMEIIEFPGYIQEEKINIARQFLIPEQLLQTGLDEEKIIFTEKALGTLVESYTYEAGVRNLERQIGSVLRKIARKKSEGLTIPSEIDAELVKQYLGPVEFFPQGAEAEDEIGLATAIAWTENGGEIMPVEVLVMPGKGNLQITGQIGDIMQESAQAALSYLKSKGNLFNIPEDFFEDSDIHIHIPEGSIPKDGPSAGITLATALTSSVLGVPVRHEVAMTGEITLRGRVLPIGGVREKVLAAHRSGIKTILLPSKNEKDLIEIPETIRRELNIIFVDHMDQVLSEALTSQPIYSKPKKVVTHKKRKSTSDDEDVPDKDK